MDETIVALAGALKALWEIDISACPRINGVNEKLTEVKYNIDHGLVDMDRVNSETGGFMDVHELYRALELNRPAEDTVLSHGDFCLPNIFVENGRATGYLDWGTGGVADRWQDIALCVRSLGVNLRTRPEYCEEELRRYTAMLFSELGLEPDGEKMRYYRLLDALF